MGTRARRLPVRSTRHSTILHDADLQVPLRECGGAQGLLPSFSSPTLHAHCGKPAAQAPRVYIRDCALGDDGGDDFGSDVLVRQRD
jgi:hypothetical protein